MIRPGSGRAQTAAAPAFEQPGFLCGRPGVSEPGDERAEPSRLEPGEDTLAQGRAAQVFRHTNTQAARPPHVRPVPPSLSRTKS